MRIAYAADFDWRQANLARIEIVRETEKTYTVANYVRLIGYLYFGKVTRVDQYHVFDTLTEAQAWLLDRAAAEITKIAQELVDAQEYEKKLRVVLGKIAEETHV